MTAIRNTTPQPRVKLTPRRRDEVLRPRPCGGDHQQLVNAALKDTLHTQKETLDRLAKV